MGQQQQNSGGYGEDIAVLDAGYYLSQIILSVCMGQLVESTGMPHLYIGMAAATAFVAAICSYKMVAFTQEDVLLQRQQLQLQKQKQQKQKQAKLGPGILRV